MEKKEPVKISLPLFITIIVLLVACISGIYVFMQNQKLDKEIAGLKEQISKTQSEKNELQEKLNKISDVANNNETDKIESAQKNMESTSNLETTVKQKEEDFDTVATLYSNNKVTIELKKSDKLQMWKYNVEEWKTAEYNKEYDVEGISGEISRILLTTFPASDVEPALIILSKDGKISYVDFIELHNAFEKKTSIKSFTAKEKVTDIKDIVDIKKSTNESIVVVDNKGKEFVIWGYDGVE